MLFITNRLPARKVRPHINPGFEQEFYFDLDNNASSNSVFFCKTSDYQQHTEIGNVTFLHQLKNAQQRQILIYIHGFTTLPKDALEYARELQDLCNQAKPNEILVIPLIWPCDNDFGVVKDYWDDQKSADQSAFAFSRVLEKFLAWRSSETHNPSSNQCYKRLNILAHSMGNRVLRETLAIWQKYHLPEGVPLIFRNTFLVAADIVNESLHKGERGEAICHSSRNVIVYYASDDLALRASKVSNLRHGIASRRLGHTGPEDMNLTPRNVYAVDCDDVNTLYDNPRGHTYFRSGTKEGEAGQVFNHIFSALLSGRVFSENQFKDQFKDQFPRRAIITQEKT